MAIPITTANKKTLLQLLQAACQELGIASPSSVVSNSDDLVIQLLALANREGKEFYSYAHRKGGWQELQVAYSFTVEGYSLTGNTTSGSAIITGISSTTDLEVGMRCTGSGIASNARISTIDSATQVTLDFACTATATAASLVFGKDKYSLPSDFAYFLQQTFWDGSYRWQLLGPLEAQEKNVILYGISPVGPRRRFWVEGNYIYLNPPPSNITDTIKFDYYSNAWCQSSGGTLQSKWTDDTDYYNLDDDAFIMGVKWRWLAAKGMNYAQEKRDYDMICQRLMARNGGNRALPLNATAAGIRLLNDANVPDSGWGI